MILREQGVDMWIIRNDEVPLYRQISYREHPVYTSLLPENHEGQVVLFNLTIKRYMEFLHAFTAPQSSFAITPVN